jgi:phosphohistidine phosphatase
VVTTYEQSGVVPFRRDGEAIEVMLIRNNSGRRWIVPKGLVEAGMSPAESAAMEAYEEAGVSGRVGDEVIGTYEYNKWEGVCRVDMFLMEVDEVLDEWPEDFRERQWVALERAVELAQPDPLKQIIASVPEWLGRRNTPDNAS